MVLDTNLCLRYLLGDIPSQSEAAEIAIGTGHAEIIPEVLCECVYVLSGSVYSIPRSTVADSLTSFLDEVDCERKPIMKRALTIYGATALDFVDCILIATSEIANAEILTFDKKLKARLSTD